MEPEEPRFLNFPHLPEDAKYADGKPAMNKYSSTVTRGHEFPGAQVGSVDSACQGPSNTVT